MEDTPTNQPDSPEDKSGGSFDQSDIDALLAGEGVADAGDAAADTDNTSGVEETAIEGGDEVSQADIDALLGGAVAAADAVDDSADAQPATEPDERLDTLGRPFDEAAAAMAAAIEEEKATASAVAASDATPFSPQELPDTPVSDAELNRVSMLGEVSLQVKIQLGHTRMLVEDVLKLGEGSVVELDKLAGDPVDILINDRLVATGEVLILNDNFCVRVSNVVSHDPHRITT